MTDPNPFADLLGRRVTITDPAHPWRGYSGVVSELISIPAIAGGPHAFSVELDGQHSAAAVTRRASVRVL